MTGRGDSRTRILLYFVLGIALPSGLLGFLAFRGIQNERALVERDRRSELEGLGERIAVAGDRRLQDLGDRLATLSGDELTSFVRDEPSVRATFTVDPGRGIRMAAASGLLFERGPGASGSDGWDASASPLRSARRQEVANQDLEGALDQYVRVLDRAPADPVRGAALSGIARIQRKLGLGTASLKTYERLASELGDVRSSAGIPFGAAAGLELAILNLEKGDTVRAASHALELYRDLVGGRWVLTPARFGLLTSEAKEILSAAATGAGARPGLADTLEALSAAEVRSRAEAGALLQFEEAADRWYLQGDPQEAPIQGTVRTGNRSYPTVVLGPSSAGGAADRGWIVDPAALAREAVSAAAGDPVDRFAWTLRSPRGEAVAASDGGAAQDAPTVATTLPGFPTWVLELSHSQAALAVNPLTSRRAIYLYAFLLIAGILLSGLVLTLRAVGRELELARMKSDFVSTVSHEFKSPLTAIRQLAEMLRADRVRSEEHRYRYYDVLLQQSERLSMLVDNVLDSARMEAGERTLSLEPTDPRSLIEEAVADVGRRVAHAGFTLQTALAPSLPRARLDPEAFGQALGNLIDNGVKYSGRSRRVVVRGYPENGHVVVAVQDFGIGMTPEETTRVFERFYRGGAELTRAVKGTGLGLTMVKQIVEAHGGRVAVESEPGKGSTFTMRFPAVDPAAPPSVHG